MASHCQKTEHPYFIIPFWLSIFVILISLNLSNQSEPPLPLTKLNPRLLKAYTALQAWKNSIISDPNNITSNWSGIHVCNYTGIYCAPAPDEAHIFTVAGIDLNHANITGSLPDELGLLTDLALFHINSNDFCGSLPDSFRNLHLLYELDISGNRFSGPFPEVVLDIPQLKYLDIRFNEFHGNIPSSLFDLKLDALFINNNKFQFSLPENLGNSSVSVVVFANNDIKGGLPSCLDKMKDTLNEIIIMNSGLTGCLTPEIGFLEKVTVFDVSFNNLFGTLPESIEGMKSLEQLNVAHNKFSGIIPKSICTLPRLENLTYSYNYLNSESPECIKFPQKDERNNCIPDRPLQRSPEECGSVYNHHIVCNAFGGFYANPLSPPATAYNQYP